MPEAFYSVSHMRGSIILKMIFKNSSHLTFAFAFIKFPVIIRPDLHSIHQRRAKMTADRRKFARHDRRKNGDVFRNAPQIQRVRKLALEKLEQYEKDENVGVKAVSTLFAAGIFIITALAGLISGYEKVVFLAVAGAVASLITGEMSIRAAKKAARKRFIEDNRHLEKYLR